MDKVFTSFLFIYSVLVTVLLLMYLDTTENTIRQLETPVVTCKETK